MKKTNLSIKAIYMLFIAAVFSSCIKEPETAFMASATSVYVNDEITFTNQSQNAVTYKWDFGDGTTSTEASPKKTFAAAGAYEVKLTAYSKKEKKQKDYSQRITINEIPHKFYAKIDGVTVEFIVDDINYEEGYGGEGGGIGWATPKKYSSSISKVDANNTNYVSIRIGSLLYQGGYTPEVADFNAFITAKNYSYSADADNGVSITYTDAAGTQWSTDEGSQDQTGSVFTITNATPGQNAIGDDMIYYEATFNCKFYNTSGQSKTVTGGFMKAAFGNI